MLIARSHSIIPFAVRLIPLNRERGEFLIGDLDSRCVGISIKSRLDTQPLVGCCASDQIDYGLPTDQRTPSPMGGDVAEHAMFN